VEEELTKLSMFIEAAVSGEIKTIRFYPGDEVEKFKQWIKNSQEELNGLPKYQEPTLTVE
jgi:predicted ribonuclease YlaK